MTTSDAGYPFCLMVKVCPATVIIPLRVVSVRLVLTEKLTEPLPTPATGELIVIQLVLLVAFHTQSSEANILMVPVPPDVKKVCDSGAIVLVQLLPPWPA